MSWPVRIATLAKGGGYPGAFNVTPAWKAAVKTNWATKDVLWLGDSTSRGIGAGEGGDRFLNMVAYSLPSALMDLLKGRGYSASRDSIFGGGGDPAEASSLFTQDSRITFGAGWTMSSSPAETAGGPWFLNNSDTTLIVFAPSDAWDQAYIYYRRNNPGMFSYKVGSGSTTNVDTAPGVDSRVQIASVSATLGTSSLTIARVSGTVQIGQIEFRNTTNARKQILNLARSGAKASAASGNTTQTAALPTLGKILEQRTAPLVALDFGINDENGGDSTTTFKTNMQAVIAMIVSKSAIPLLIGHNATASTPGAAYIQAHRELAVTNGIPYFDLASIYSWSQIQANGWNFDASSHLKAAGYAAMAAEIDKFLAWAVR